MPTKSHEISSNNCPRYSPLAFTSVSDWLKSRGFSQIQKQRPLCDKKINVFPPFFGHTVWSEQGRYVLKYFTGWFWIWIKSYVVVLFYKQIITLILSIALVVLFCNKEPFELKHSLLREGWSIVRGFHVSLNSFDFRESWTVTLNVNICVFQGKTLNLTPTKTKYFTFVDKA